jgi:hypothetical protein
MWHSKMDRECVMYLMMMMNAYTTASKLPPGLLLMRGEAMVRVRHWTMTSVQKKIRQVFLLCALTLLHLLLQDILMIAELMMDLEKLESQMLAEIPFLAVQYPMMMSESLFPDDCSCGVSMTKALLVCLWHMQHGSRSILQ